MTQESHRHISMELTADEARVTNLSLRGNRLILTIEAELSDSQLRATGDGEGSPSVNTPLSAVFREEETKKERSDTEFINHPPQSADAPAIGLAAPADVLPGVLAMGSENLPPAPSASFAPQMKSMTVEPERMESAPEPVIHPVPLPRPAVPAAPEPPMAARPPHGHVPSNSTTIALKPEELGGERRGETAMLGTVSLSLDALQGWGDTGESTRERVGLPRASDPDATVPIPGLAIAAPSQPAPAAAEPAMEMRFGGDAAGAPPPAFAPAQPPVPPPAPELRLGGDSDAPSSVKWGEPPAPMMETWDHTAMRTVGGISAPGEVLALSEDSNAVGGVRHGEPLPAISFGSDVLPPLAPASVPRPAPAPAPVPPALEPVPPLGFETSVLPAPVQTPTAPPVSPIGFADAQSPVSAPPFMPADDVPTQMAMQPPPPEPRPEAPKAEAPQPQSEEKPEAGGTTVLIRYTCPKCKTQGMQAVDKVGTVVNCSNCGKAMRLVMKK